MYKQFKDCIVDISNILAVKKIKQGYCTIGMEITYKDGKTIEFVCEDDDYNSLVEQLLGEEKREEKEFKDALLTSEKELEDMLDMM